jgi:hypothetical protein
VPEVSFLGQLMLVAVFCGSLACWLLKVDDTLPLTLGAGSVGLYLEPWVSLGIGPDLFEYSLLSCLVGALAGAFILGTLQSALKGWAAPARPTRREPIAL